MKSRSLSNSPHLQEIKRQKYSAVRRKLTITFCTILGLFVGLGFLSQWQGITIKEIQVEGNKVVDTENIKTFIEEKISGYYALIFSKKSVLIYPRQEIERELSSTFKRLNFVSLGVDKEGKLDVKVSERSASYTWCGNTLPSEGMKLEESHCYFMDNTGYIFDEAPYFSGDVYFRFFGAVEGDSPEGKYLAPDRFPEFSSFAKYLESSSIKPSFILFKGDGDAEIYLSSVPPWDKTPKIMLREDSDMTKTAENLEAAISVEPLKSAILHPELSLEYIDLRFGNKVYYKLTTNSVKTEVPN